MRRLQAPYPAREAHFAMSRRRRLHGNSLLLRRLCATTRHLLGPATRFRLSLALRLLLERHAPLFAASIGDFDEASASGMRWTRIGGAGFHPPFEGHFFWGGGRRWRP